jgi:hypothetical protein
MKTYYSQHPKSRLSSYQIQFLSDCRMVRFSSHSKSGRNLNGPRLDRFVMNKKISWPFIIKWSRLAVKNVRSGFRMLKTKWWPTIRKPEVLSRFWMVHCLDRFIKKRVIKNILFMTKWSRLAIIQKPYKKSVWFVSIWKPDRPDFGCWLYI